MSIPVPSDDQQAGTTTPEPVSAFMEAFFQASALLMGVVEVHGDDLLHIVDNTAAARILGRAPHETPGRISSEMGVPREAIRRWIEPCNTAERTGRPVEFEYERRTESETRIMEAHLEFLGRSAQDIPRFSYAVKDVTDHRRRLEEAHRIQREKALECCATEILQSLTDGFYALDRDWRFTFVNKEAERLLQKSHDELIGVPFWEAFPATRELEVHRVFHEAMRSQVTQELEEYYDPLDTWFSAKIYPSADGLSVYFRDTTEQRKMATALAEEHATVELERRRLKAILDILPVGVFIIDASGRIVQGNQAGRAIWGFRTPASQTPDAYGIDYPAWWPKTGQRLESHEWAVARALATGEMTIAEELLIETGDGARKTILNYALPICDPDGEKVGAVAVNVDITNRKLMEEELREHAEALVAADRAKDEFLAMLGHELRNPLGTVASAAELLRILCAEDAECREPVDALREQVRHMSRLLDDLLDVSRITTGRLELRREPVDINSLIRKAIEGTRTIIETRDHHLSVRYSEQPLHVHGDAARLQQVFGNLLTNAARYTPPGGRIWMEVGESADQVMVRVCDNGEGIASDLLPRIFDLFTQGARPLDRAPGGLGVGLTVVRRLVEMHGGTVEVRSPGPGLGSAFAVRLPRVSIAPENPAARPVEAGSRRPLRILVVEDNRLARTTLTRILECDGHCVGVAADGPSALSAARDLHPDVVLLDIGLPGIDGYEVARRLRSDPILSGALLVAVTGYGQDVDIARSRDAGIDEHLVKPLDFERLDGILRARGAMLGTADLGHS